MTTTSVSTTKALPVGIAVVRVPLPTGDWVVMWSPGLSKREAAAARLAVAAIGGTASLTFAQLFALMATAA